MGGTGSLPPMEFSLPNGVKMEVVGRIDRVDKAEDENGRSYVLLIINQVQKG